MTLEEALSGRGIVKGSRDTRIPQWSRYEVRHYIDKPAKDPDAYDLIRLWLDGDSCFPLSQYREWIDQAERFLEEKRHRYSFTEHKDLLARSFDIWLRYKD